MPEQETEQELIARAMSALGKRTSPRKAVTSAENGRNVSEATRAKLRAAQKARRERERRIAEEDKRHGTG